MEPNGQLERGVHDALRQEPLLAESSSPPTAPPVQVSIADGIVVLAGAVATPRQKRAAEAAARRVAGVRGVVNNLSVDDRHTGVAAHVAPEAADQDLAVARAVLDALVEQPAAAAARLTPAVTRGRVTLAGSVPERRQRAEVEDAVRSVPGVVAVTNELTSERVADAATSALAEANAEATGSADGIEVAMRDRTMHVSGHVSSWDERQAVLRSVSEAVDGYPVVDQMDVEPGQ
jgi:osmotically-inducible protein OsmY